MRTQLVQPPCSLIFQVFANGGEAPIRQLSGKREDKGFERMFARYYRVKAEPRFTARKHSTLQLWKQACHDQARFACPTGSKNGQQPFARTRWLLCHQRVDQFRYFLNHSLAPKEISGIALREGTQTFVGIARLALGDCEKRPGGSKHIQWDDKGSPGFWQSPGRESHAYDSL